MVRAPSSGIANERCSGSSSVDAGRHVHERAALEAGRVLGREAVGRADERSEVLQDDGVAAIRRGLERVEHHALGRDELDDRVADLVQLARRLEASEQRRSRRSVARVGHGAVGVEVDPAQRRETPALVTQRR